MTPADGSTFNALAIVREIFEPGLQPYVAEEVKQEQVRIAEHKREASRCGGVCISGTAPDPFKARNLGEMIRDAELERQRREDFDQSPRGTFLAALNEALEYPTYGGQIETARSAYYRGIADERHPPSQGEVAVIINALSEVPGKAARKALRALAEVLLDAHRRTL